MNKRTKARIEALLRRSRLDELLDWYAKFKPGHRFATIPESLYEDLVAAGPTAAAMGIDLTDDGSTVRYRGFILRAARA